MPHISTFTLFTAISLAVSLTLSGCTTDLDIENLRFGCEEDGDCGSGYVCAPAADGRSSCQPEGQVFTPDAGDLDAEPDTEPDTEPDAEPDAQDADDVEDADVEVETWYDDIVFLSAADSGDDENSGVAPDSPVSSFAHAVNIARDEGRSVLYLSQGAHTVDAIVDFPLSILGGRDEAADWDETEENSTLSPSDFAEFGDGGIITTLVITRDEDDRGEEALLSNLLIRGPTIPESAGASVATLRISHVDEDALRVENSEIHGGVAAQGLAGRPGDPGTTANSGEPGDDHTNAVYTDNPVSGGAGGALTQCAHGGSSGFGGNGGASLGCSYDLGDSHGESGWTGRFITDGADGGGGGEGGRNRCQSADPLELSGDPGAPGEPGAHGTGGDRGGSSVGAFDEGGLWSSSALGQPGAHGEPGGGGGGGGAGGGRYGSSNSFYFAGSGGGGGSGGCGGASGQPGGPGGASFSVLLIDAQATVENVEIHAGAGGAGGEGGASGCGSPGGEGGGGGEGNPNRSQPGNPGGNGGNGGNGGGGAGGHGGPTIGIALVDASQYQAAELQLHDFDDGSPGGDGGTDECDNANPESGDIAGTSGPRGSINEEVNFDDL